MTRIHVLACHAFEKVRETYGEKVLSLEWKKDL